MTFQHFNVFYYLWALLWLLRSLLSDWRHSFVSCLLFSWQHAQYLFLYNKLFWKIVALNTKHLSSHTVSMAQEPRSRLVEWFWLGVGVAVIMLPGTEACLGMKASLGLRLAWGWRFPWDWGLPAETSFQAKWFTPTPGTLVLVVGRRLRNLQWIS